MIFRNPFFSRWMLLAMVVWMPCWEVQAQQQLVPSPPRRTPELNTQFHRAETAWRSGSSLLEAKARVDRVLRALPDDLEARKLRAHILLAMRNPSAALLDARHAVQLQPADGEAWVLRCEAARLSGDRTEAEAALDEALTHLQHQAELHLRLAWNATEMGHLDKAEASTRLAMHLDRTLPTPYYQLARIFLLRKQRDEAATVLASGFEAALLDPVLVERDALLNQLATHPLLQRWLRP
jgi:tetratricopeptide (TPR) repeat protein